ncbi:MaoC family dehydratase [Clostridium rectalis]|uniref:MaoC family dehydratase n=1 Tax=Clostridium rectalis TaxID=2040295 RepID=UPI000F63F661|nr:MaoC family dehydratase [Clostridium rectalis]
MPDIRNFYVGQSAEYVKELGEEEVKFYAKATGDYNYIHIDDKRARSSFFKGKIVHGMLTAGLISAVIGTKLPGEGNIYLSQSFQFVKYVRVGEKIKAIATIKKIDNKKRVITLETLCTNKEEKIVLKGEAKVYLLP